MFSYFRKHAGFHDISCFSLKSNVLIKMMSFVKSMFPMMLGQKVVKRLVRMAILRKNV